MIRPTNRIQCGRQGISLGLEQSLYRVKGELALRALAVILFLWPFVVLSADDAVVRSSGHNQFEKVTGDDAQPQQAYWDQKFDTPTYVYGREASLFLKESIAKVPPGRALDVAMGEGRNAVFLATKKFDVLGVDLSSVAIRKARRLARENKVKIQVEQADLNGYQVPSRAFDLVVQIDFFLPSLFPKLLEGVKPGGWIVLETATRESSHPDVKANPDLFPTSKQVKTALADWEVIRSFEKSEGQWKTLHLFARRKR